MGDYIGSYEIGEKRNYIGRQADKGCFNDRFALYDRLE